MRSFLVTVVLLVMVGPVAAQTTLIDGSTVDVGTPGSKVYATSADGRRYPLWDGVHSLSNGAVLTIRGGVLVSAPWRPDGGVATESACELLLERVCGKQGQCEGSTACDLAQQLQRLEQDAMDAGRGGRADGQCDAALRDADFFQPCRP